MSQLADRQAALTKNTADLARRTLTKDLKDLLPQEASELAGAARQQNEIASQFDAVQQAMERASSQARNPEAQAVAAGIQHARQRDLDGQMRAAGDRLERNQLGQAMDQQRRIEEDLRDVLEILSGRAPKSPGGDRPPEDRNAAQDIRRLQEELNRRTKELEKSSARTDKSGADAQYEALSRQQDRLAGMLREGSEEGTRNDGGWRKSPSSPEAKPSRPSPPAPPRRPGQDPKEP